MGGSEWTFSVAFGELDLGLSREMCGGIGVWVVSYLLVECLFEFRTFGQRGEAD